LKGCADCLDRFDICTRPINYNNCRSTLKVVQLTCQTWQRRKLLQETTGIDENLFLIRLLMQSYAGHTEMKLMQVNFTESITFLTSSYVHTKSSILNMRDFSLELY